MSFDEARAVAMDAMFGCMGVPATVTPIGLNPITTSVIWTAPLDESLPRSGELSRRESVRIASVDRRAVASLPRGSVIVAPELAGGPLVGWRVDSPHQTDADELRVIVVRDPTAYP